MSEKTPIALIVEDRMEVAMIWKEALSLYPTPIDIRHAVSLSDAKMLASKIPPPDLILLDLRLTDADDQTTLAAIPFFKSLNPSVVVIVISGYITPDIATLAIQQGAHGVCEKMNMQRQQDLWGEIRTSLANAPAEATKALRYTSELIQKLGRVLL